MTHEIAVSIEPISDNNQAMLRGVIDYVSTHPDLRVHKIGAIPFLPLERLIDWKGAGVICTTEKLERLNTVANLKIPCVSVSLHQDPPASLPTVHSDNEAIGKLAAEHLFEIGLRKFAFVGHLNWLHNQERLLGFQTELRKKGADCEIINVQFSNSKQWVWPSEIRQRPLANALKIRARQLNVIPVSNNTGHASNRCVLVLMFKASITSMIAVLVNSDLKAAHNISANTTLSRLTGAFMMPSHVFWTCIRENAE